MPKILSYLVTTLVLIVLGAAGAVWFVTQQFGAAGPLAAQRVVMIEKGQGFSAIAHQLEEEGVIEDARLFMMPVLLRGDHKRIQAGEYAFAAHSSPADVLAKLRSGDVVAHQITLIEGWTNRQIAAALLQENALTGDLPATFYEAVQEGQFLPDTVQFTRGMTRAQILAERHEAMQALLATRWPNRAADLPFNTMQEALVLASIIERETARTDERARVAGVYVNRLRIGMRLQADPTVQYGIERAQGAVLGRALTSRDLKVETVFNTYMKDGLPPTPICNPSRASIEAALNPEPTNVLYFVADGKGGHVFAATLAEHNKNVAAYRQILKYRTLKAE